MTDTFRALCTEVLAFNNGESPYNFSGLNPYDRDNAAFDAWQDIRQRLKSALAEPEPQTPSKSELFRLLMQSGGANRVVSVEWLEPFARAVLAQWGADQAETNIERERQEAADQELEACCQALYDRYDSVRRATGFPGSDMSDWLRAARRPKPLILKEQALKELDAAILRGDCFSTSTAKDIIRIRRALEQLPDDN